MSTDSTVTFADATPAGANVAPTFVSAVVAVPTVVAPYALAATVGVTPNILNARPTDGLFADGRTDEDQIGATYDELEWAMLYIENKESYELNKRQKVAMDIYKIRNRANKHKMDPIPVCLIPKDFLI